jgi:hypothetical protein
VRWEGHVALVKEVRIALQHFVRKSERKRPVGKSNYRWDKNTKINFRVMEYVNVD